MRSRDTERDWLEGNDSRTEQERQADPARLTDQQIEGLAKELDALLVGHAPRSGEVLIREAATALRAERATCERLRERLAAYENLRAEVVYAIQRGYGSTSGVKETLAALDRLDQEKP